VHFYIQLGLEWQKERGLIGRLIVGACLSHKESSVIKRVIYISYYIKNQLGTDIFIIIFGVGKINTIDQSLMQSQVYNNCIAELQQKASYTLINFYM
jgi:hypothetical protein